jgi:signal transduction histidine kinase
MQALLDDLIDFNRGRLGLGITIVPVETDLARLFTEAIEEWRIANPERTFELTIEGECKGAWDRNRIHQLLSNLVSNAIRYGESGAPVRVTLSGLPGEVVFAVKNRGPAIDPSYISRIFDPLERGPSQERDQNHPGGLGLGLFISREIVTAHGGEIRAESKDGETVFTVRLPCDRRAKSRPHSIREDEGTSAGLGAFEI